VRAVCADSAFADPVSLLEERIGHRLHLPAAVLADPVMALMARHAGARLADFSPVTAVARLAPWPLLLIHGDADASVPVEKRPTALRGGRRPPRSSGSSRVVGHVGGYFADRTAYVERVIQLLRPVARGGSGPVELVVRKYTDVLRSRSWTALAAFRTLLRHLDSSLASRPEDELIAQVLGGAEPPGHPSRHRRAVGAPALLERRALGASGLVRDHRVPPREAIRLAALWELAERWYPDERPAVTTPGAALHLLQGLRA